GAKTKKHLKERKQVETDVRRALRTRVRRYEDTRNLNNFVTLAGARSPLLIGIDVYDRDPWLLTCANGVLDLRIGKLRAARREDFCTRAIAVAYDPHARCPRFVQFLEEVFHGDHDVIIFVRRLVGSMLTGVVRDHI